MIDPYPSSLSGQSSIVASALGLGIGVVIAVLVVLVLIGVGACVYFKKRKRSTRQLQADTSVNNKPTMEGDPRVMGWNDGIQLRQQPTPDIR